MYHEEKQQFDLLAKLVTWLVSHVDTSPLKTDAPRNMSIMDGIRHHQSMRYNNIMTPHLSRRETTRRLTIHIRNLTGVPCGYVNIKGSCLMKHGYYGWNTTSSKHEI
jgi:hypothetical protein